MPTYNINVTITRERRELVSVTVPDGASAGHAERLAEEALDSITLLEDEEVDLHYWCGGPPEPGPGLEVQIPRNAWFQAADDGPLWATDGHIAVRDDCPVPLDGGSYWMTENYPRAGLARLISGSREPLIYDPFEAEDGDQWGISPWYGHALAQIQESGGTVWWTRVPGESPIVYGWLQGDRPRVDAPCLILAVTLRRGGVTLPRREVTR